MPTDRRSAVSAVKKKTGFMVMRWLREVGDAALADDELSSTDKRHVMLVAYWRSIHADSNGQNCYPAQSTLAGKTTLNSRVAIRAADRWLIENHYMRETSKGVRGLRHYRLILPAVDPESVEPDGPPTVHLDTAQMDHPQSICGDSDGLADGPADGPPTVHYLLPTNVSEEEGGGALPPHTSVPTGRSCAATPTSSERKAAHKIISAAMKSKPKVWDDLNYDDDRLIVAGTRLLRGGWTFEQIAARLTDLGDPKIIKSKSAWIAARLVKLPDRPDDDEQLSDLVEHDPKHWARKIALAVCESFSAEAKAIDEAAFQGHDDEWWAWIYEQPSSIPMMFAGAIAHDLQLRVHAVEELVSIAGKSEGARNGAITDEYIDKFVRMLTMRTSIDPTTDTELAADLRAVFERLPEIAATLVDHLKAQWIKATGQPF